jgi:hypothetical protein
MDIAAIVDPAQHIFVSCLAGRIIVIATTELQSGGWLMLGSWEPHFFNTLATSFRRNVIHVFVLVEVLTCFNLNCRALWGMAGALWTQMSGISHPPLIRSKLVLMIKPMQSAGAPGMWPKLGSFLRVVRALMPKITVVAESEANHNTATFLDRFYASMIDCLESASAAQAHLCAG